MFTYCSNTDQSARLPVENIHASHKLFPDIAVTQNVGPGHASFIAAPARLHAHGTHLAICPDTGNISHFKGWFDNIGQIAAELGVNPANPALVYAAATSQWGDEADTRIIGQYAALIAARDGHVRLARSPIAAPPLHYAAFDGLFVASSLQRILLAAGLPKQLSERKLADSLFFNLTGHEGWYEGAWRLGLGEICSFHPATGLARPRRWYDPLRIPAQPRASDAEYIAETRRLLQQAAKCAVSGAQKPGTFLSGGLDSPITAASALNALPDDQPLPSFTYVPADDWDGVEPRWIMGNERPVVEAFARLHPRIQPHFLKNEGRDFDYRWDQMFAAIGAVPPGVAIAWLYHGVFEAARAQGCDLLLAAELGNQTFSAGGEWAAAEYARTGKWRQAWLALVKSPFRKTPVWKRILQQCVAAQLSDKAWHIWQQVKRQPPRSANVQLAALQPAMMEKHQVAQRARAAGVIYERPFIGYRRQSIEDGFARGDIEGSDMMVAMEEIHGIRYRNVPAYRPLVEFCLGLPTRMFMRDGQDRWLARQLGKGIMPEAQRTERRMGEHNADWHQRSLPRLGQFRAELETAAANPALNALIDYQQVIQSLDDWPVTPRFDDDTLFRQRMQVPRALMMTRFIRHVHGWNEG